MSLKRGDNNSGGEWASSDGSSKWGEQVAMGGGGDECAVSGDKWG